MLLAATSRLARLVMVGFVLLSVAAAACGSADPDERSADWEDNFDKTHQASSTGNHEQAIAMAEAYLKRYPGNADAHLMAGDALKAAALAASDASRPARFKEAAQHYDQVLERSRNSMRRFLASNAMVQIYGPQGLNQPTDGMRYGRMIITEEPKRIDNYQPLLFLQQEAHQYDEAVKLLAEAKTAMEPSAEAWATYGGIVHDLVALTPDFPADKGLALTADAVNEIDQALAKYGPDEKLFRNKGALLRAQAQLEPDAAKKRALEDASARAFDEMDRLMK